MDDDGNVNGEALDNASGAVVLSCPTLFRLCRDS